MCSAPELPTASRAGAGCLCASQKDIVLIVKFQSEK
jgi:hypothetical protein